MHFKLRLIPTAVATLLVAACGGGGGGSSTVAANPSNGTVVDGYLNLAKVVCDANENGVYDTGEQVTYTSANGDGKFTFNPGCAHSILGGVDGTGTNADTKLPFVGLLRAPTGATVLTPLTTLLSSGMSAAEVVKALDLPAGTNLLTVDPAATNADGSLMNAELLKKSIAVQQLLQKTTEVVNSLAKMTGSEANQTVYTQVATALATTLKSGAALITGGATPVMDAAVVKSMLSTAFTNIASAASVDPVIKTALSGAGGVATLPTVINTALTGQAQVILGASAETITATTLDRQSNNIIASTVTAAVAAKTLSPSTSPAALTTLATSTQTAAAAATVVPTPTPPPVVVAVPAPAAGSTTLFTFDEASPLFTNMGAYGGALPSVVVPDNSNAGNALKIVKAAGPDSGGGTYFGLPAIRFTASRKQITAAVFSTVANSVILMKAEVSGSDSVEVAGTPTGAANTWSTVTWDFSAVDPAKTYATMAITPDKGLTASGQTYYLDNIALAPAGATPPVVVGHVPAPATGSTTLFTFDEASPLFTNMGAYGGALPSVFAPAFGDAGNALQIVKAAGPDSGGGVYFGLPAIPFTASRKQITAAVYSSVANSVILLKAEVNGSDSVEVAGTPTGAANTWSTVTWDLSAVNPAKTYATMAITPDKGLTASGQTYTLDNIALAPAAATPPPPVVPKSGVLATFDETVSLPFLGFNGAEGSSIKAAPVGAGSGLALNVLRTGGDPWAGAKVTVGAMDVSSTNTTITAKVYSPLAGIPIVLKLEGATNALTTSEIQATETVVMGWQTLSWVIPTADIKSGYSNVILLPHLNTTATVSPGESYFFDDIRLGVAVTPTPVTPTDYLYIPGDSIGFAADGVTANAVNYTMAAFQSSGINVKWPMANSAAIKLKLAVNGTFNFAVGQKLSAAVQIEDTAVGSSAQIRAYTDNVSVSKSGDTITLSVPSLPQALIYGVSANGATKAVIDFASSVRGISNALSTATNAVSTVMFGEVVNFGITGLSNQFTNMNGLRGKYKVTIVVNQLPLRKADGTQYDPVTINMPTTVSGNVEGGIVPITGYGLVGYINLTP
jgi:hypothetical protein